MLSGDPDRPGVVRGARQQQGALQQGHGQHAQLFGPAPADARADERRGQRLLPGAEGLGTCGGQVDEIRGRLERDGGHRAAAAVVARAEGLCAEFEPAADPCRDAHARVEAVLKDAGDLGRSEPDGGHRELLLATREVVVRGAPRGARLVHEVAPARGRVAPCP